MRMRVAPTAVLLLLMATSAPADPSHTFKLVPVDTSAVLPGDDPLVPDFNDGSYFSFDLMITTVDADFHAAGVDATLTGPTEFFQHPAGGQVPPDPDLIEQYPAVEFDTFFDGGPGSLVGIAWLTQEPRFIHADWFDVAAFLPDDTYRIARFGFQFLESGTATFAVEGQSFDHLGRFYPIGPFEVSVSYPEPGTLGLLAVGGLLRLRRRTKPNRD